MARAEGRQETNPFEKTQDYLGRLLGYLESLYVGLEWEAGADGPAAQGAAAQGAGGLPPRLERILADSGYLEGMSLKAQGSLSSDLQEFIQRTGYAFETEVAPLGVFKLPFAGNELSIQRKTLNAFMEKAWLVYHAALLSAYAMKPLRFERPLGGEGGLEETVRIVEAAPGEEGSHGGVHGDGRDVAHAVNNALAGIVSYVSLVMAERPKDAELQQKLGLVLEAAKKAGETLKKK